METHSYAPVPLASRMSVVTGRQYGIQYRHRRTGAMKEVLPTSTGSTAAIHFPSAIIMIPVTWS
jgi:hypothetical protein